MLGGEIPRPLNAFFSAFSLEIALSETCREMGIEEDEKSREYRENILLFETFKPTIPH